MRIATLGFVLIASLTMEVRAQTQTPPTWRLVEEWRKGGEPEGPYAFEDVVGLKAMPGGRLIVLDRKAMQAFIYDSTGRAVKTVGQRGGGPGEFQNLLGVAVAPNGRFVINDHSSARLSIFSPEGEFVRGVMIQRQPLIFFEMGWDASFDREGRLVASVGIKPRAPDARVPGAMSPFGDSTLFTERWTAEFARSDTTDLCASPVPAQTSPAQYMTVTPGRPGSAVEGRGGAMRPPGGMAVWHSIPFATQKPYFARDLDGFEWGPQEYGSGVLMRRESGKCGTVLARATLRPRARIADRIRDSAARAMHADHAHRMPREYAWYRALRVDDQNQLWVERDVDGGKRFDVFSQSGQPIAELAVPRGLITEAPQYAHIVMANGRVYGFVKDADDVRYLVAWRIVR